MKALPSIAFNNFSGTAKDVTARVYSGRQVLSSRSQHSRKRSPSQAKSRNRLSQISRLYRKLTSSQMAGWSALASRLKGTSILGDETSLTAHNAFVRINCNLALVGADILMDAPIESTVMPSVTFQDFWITPQVILFAGLEQQPSNYVLVFKMTSAVSKGVSSAWGQAVIIEPDIVPDWGDADITAQYTSVMGVSPIVGNKYFCEIYWMDKNTGFTGDILQVNSICKDTSAINKEVYAPRALITDEMIVNENGYTKSLNLEVSQGSAILSAMGEFEIKGYSSSYDDFFKKEISNFIEGNTMVYARSSDTSMLSPSIVSIMLQKLYRNGGYKQAYTISYRAGMFSRSSILFGTGAMVK